MGFGNFTAGFAEKLDLLRTALEKKVDKVAGKGLSANDYTNADKVKLEGIEVGANNYIHPTSHSADMITQDSRHLFMTNTDKENWNSKLDDSSTIDGGVF